MAGFFARLFGRGEPVEELPAAPVPARVIPRRIPEALGLVPLAEIQVEEGAAPPDFSWLDLHVDSSLIALPVSLPRFRSFTVIDVETTGLEVVYNDVLEVSALRFEGFHPTELFTCLVKPRKNKHVPTVAGDINKITDADIENAPYFSEIRGALQKFLAPAEMIVAHNLPFVVEFLYGSGIRFDPAKLYVDTLENSRRFLGSEQYFSPVRLSSFRLKDLCRFYGVPVREAPFAASGAYMTGLVFQHLLEDMAAYGTPKEASV